MGAVRVWIASCVVGLTACAVPAKQYVLKIDAKKPSEPQLCERDAETAADAAPRCKPFTGDALEAPGVASVVLGNAGVDDQYELIVKSEIKAGANSLSGFLDERITRVGGLSEAYFASIAKPDGPDDGDDAADQDLFQKVIKQLRATVPKAAAQLQQRLATNVLFEAEADDDEPTSPEAAFRGFLEGTSPDAFKPRAEAVAEAPGGAFGEPDGFVPAPRAEAFTPEYVEYLKERKLTDDAVMGHVLEWCEPSSFGGFAGKPYAEALRDHPLDRKRVLAALGFTGTALVDFVRGRGDLDLTGRLREQLAKPDGAGEDAETIQLLYDGAALHNDLGRCVANIDAVTAALKPSAAVATRAKTVRQAANELLALTADASEAFATIVEPVVVAAVVQVLEGVGEGGDVTFGPFPIQGGDTALTVMKLDGDKRTEAYSFKVSLPPKYSDRLSLSIGPVIVRRAGSLHVVTEEVEPEVTGADPMPARRRIVVNDSNGFVDAALMLHVGIYRHQWFQVGALVGFPISEPEGSRHNVLVGVGFRHEIGLELGFGASVFMTRALKDDYAEPIDLSAPTNMTLTADQVSEDVFSHAYFVYLGISTDLLEKL